MKTNIKKLGKSIKKQRILKKYSQEKLANMCNIEISQISRIERGVINTSVKNIFLISNVLQICPSVLFENILEKEFSFNKTTNHAQN